MGGGSYRSIIATCTHRRWSYPFPGHFYNPAPLPPSPTLFSIEDLRVCCRSAIWFLVLALVSMASTPVLSFRPAAVQACATAGDRRSQRKAASAGGSNWWTPLFGWPAEADYIEGAGNGGAAEGKAAAAAEGEAAARKARSVAFTDEKARRLRMMTAETSNFHDVMYHSSIAARLASDFSRRSSQ